MATFLFVTILSAFLSFAIPATAQPAGECAIPPGLGSSLLFPYFEVDLENPSGVSTLLSVNNGSDSPVMTRLVIWTDWGVPTAAFDIWLDPFDVQTINMRSIFEGNIPSTGEGGTFPGVEGCGEAPPFHQNPVLNGDTLGQLKAFHTGDQTATSCAGASFGDGTARGYITVDVVDQCSGVEAILPRWTPQNSEEYFDNGEGGMVAIISNQLWGDFVFVDFAGKAAQGSAAVSIWADDSAFGGPDVYTFYGRFHNYDGRDRRVPLPSRWSQRFLNGGPFGGGADLIVWRDPEGLTDFVECGDQPGVFPLLDSSVAFDEESNLFPLGTVNFPLVTQRRPISELGIPTDFGWLLVDSRAPAPMGISQAWVETTLTSSSFELSAAWPGMPTRFACGVAPSVN